MLVILNLEAYVGAASIGNVPHDVTCISLEYPANILLHLTAECALGAATDLPNVKARRCCQRQARRFGVNY